MLEIRVFILANWKIASCLSSSGAVVTCLCGHVFGHARFAPGQFVQTSIVGSHRVEFDSLIVVTRNGSEYWLGKPDPSEAFPMQRLMRYLQENESVQIMSQVDHQTLVPNGDVAVLPARIPLDRAAVNLTVFRRRSTDRQAPTRLDLVAPAASGRQAAGADEIRRRRA
jgi:hypothetical protein